MKKSMGKILEVFSKDNKTKVQIIKLKKGYRVIAHKRFTNGWRIIRTRTAQDKKYAERRFIDILTELF